jgi:conjugative relaxase-like TrwC/TraI family protein
VLSIGKVGGGQGDPRYYIDNVATGKDDYYTGHGEAQGQWEGSGAGGRGLTGGVEDEQFLSLLTEPSTTATRPKTVLAYDLTFSAPKSVSVVYGIGDRTISPVVRAAHDEAVREALGYLERHATWTRRGANGKHLIRGDGLTVAASRHRTSRAGDPQLHTHAVVANMTVAEGRETALDGRALYAHQRTAGFLYQAALRKNLTETLGVEWEPVRNGAAEISGIDDRVLKHFSRRSQEIRERLGQLGARSARAAEVAALETRRAKDYNVPADRLRQEWRARATEFGLDRQVLDLVLDRRPPGPALQPNLRAVAEDLGAPDGITENASTFDRRDVLRDWAEAHREGASVERLEALADRWLASPQAVQLEQDGRRPQLGGARYSTPGMLAVEDRILTGATSRQDTGVAQLDAARVEDLLATRGDIADEQAAMVRSLTTSGDGVQVIRAAAGTGGRHEGSPPRETLGRPKASASSVRGWPRELPSRWRRSRASTPRRSPACSSTSTKAMALLRDQCWSSTRRAWSARARSTGSHSTPPTWSPSWSSSATIASSRRSMPAARFADSRGTSERSSCTRSTAKSRRGIARLSRNYARARSRHGATRTAITGASSPGRPPTSCVRRWWRTGGGAARRPEAVDAVMIAHRRSDVADLNALARERMARDGRLGEEELMTDRRAFAVGDRVIARRNDRRAGVVNGTRGEVVGVDLGRRTVSLRTADGSGRDLDSSYLDDGWLDHAYALTAHAAQGATVDRSFVLGSDELYREWGYTALSRHRAEARFYVVSPGSVERALPGLEPDRDTVTDDVVAMLSPSRRKELALEVADRAAGGRAQYVRDGAQREIEAARRRIEAMRAEQAELGRLRRSRRAAIEKNIARQEEAVQRWSSQAETIADTPDLNRSALGVDHEVPARIDPDDARVAVLDPDMPYRRELGSRPASFRAREAWTREAVAPLGRDAPPLAPPSLEPAGLDDVGLDL